MPPVIAGAAGALIACCCFGVVCANAAIAGVTDGELPQTSVSVSRSKDVFTVESRSRVVASRDVAWAVLTDYDGYVDFVPGMISSQRVEDQPLQIEQHGVFSLLFLRKHVYATLEVQETWPSRLQFRALDGNLRRLETDIDIHGDGDEVVVTYRSVIEPDFWVAPLIGTSVVRRSIRKKLSAVADEIDRRARLGAQASPGAYQ